MKYYIVKVKDKDDHETFKAFSNKREAKAFSKSVKSFCAFHYFKDDYYTCKCKHITLHEVNEKLIEKGRM